MEPQKETPQHLRDRRLSRHPPIALIGEEAAVKEAEAVLASLDVDLGLITKSYRLRMTPPDRVDRLLRQLVTGQRMQRVYSSAQDTEANLLIVTTTEALHQRVAGLIADLDSDAAGDDLRGRGSPVRFYKLMNTTAGDVLCAIYVLIPFLARVGPPTSLICPVPSPPMAPKGPDKTFLSPLNFGSMLPREFRGMIKIL